VTTRSTDDRIVELSDATLVAFVSDTHMGGDPGADLFESHDELAALFTELAAHPGPVELVLAGDIFDLLRVGEVPPGENRASVTLARAEYAALFEAWRSFAAADDRRVVYLPGNHDVEVWWNRDVQRTLERAGLVHEFSLTYGARYRSAPDRLIFCEHGNQVDDSNARKDYDDPSEPRSATTWCRISSA
jgi:UDP-2,3-diacylglucosamine pyrophosphatase LpxH